MTIQTKSNLLGQASTIAAEAVAGANTKTRIAAIHTDTIDTSLIFHTWLTPAQITADQNDYSPTDLATNSVLRLDTDAPRTITGIATGALGRVLVIHNVGSHLLILADQSGSSTATNRLAIGGANLYVGPGRSVTLVYDATSSRWRGANLPSARLPNMGIMWQTVSAPNSTGNRYAIPYGSASAFSSGVGFGQWQALAPFTIYAVRATHVTAMSTANHTYTLTLNGSDVGSSAFTINAAGTSGAATGLEIAVAAGDLLAPKCVQSSAEAQAALYLKYWFEAA